VAATASEGSIDRSEGQFPKEYLIAYNLVCYECHLGNRKQAMQHLEEANDLAAKRYIRQMALEDPDLERLWKTFRASDQSPK
jgi:hypothetical protein